MPGSNTEHSGEDDQRRGDPPRSLRQPSRAEQSEMGQLREQVVSAQAEAQRVKSQWLAAQRAVPATPVNVQREAEIIQISSQLRRSQRDLTTERKCRASDADDYANKIANLEKNLLDVKIAASHTRSRNWMITTAGVAAALILLGVLFLPRLRAIGTALKSPAVVPAEAIASLPETPENFPAPQTTPIPRPVSYRAAPIAPGSKPTFTFALARLNQALNAVPGRTPQQVLFSVQKARSTPQNPVCSFEWKDSGPALLFGDDHKGTNLTSLATTLTRCAEAVEQAR